MDIRGQYADLLPEIKQLVCDVIDSGRFILGPNVRALESEFAATIGYGEAVSVANGTDALELSLQALGVGRDDEVITTPYTFYATAEAIARTGATPVFADIDPDTFCLDPAAAEQAITERTRAIIPVHIFGQPADLPAFRDIADRHGLAMIEDAAQAIGSTVDGYQAGSFGDAATFSFFPTKNLPAMGDGGMVMAATEEVAERLRMLRFHGSRDKQTFSYVGVNSRLDEMQATIVRRLLREVAGLERRPPRRRRPLPRARPRRVGDVARRGGEPSACLPPLRRPLAGARRDRPAAEGCRDRRRGLLRDAAPPAAGVRAPRAPRGQLPERRAGIPRGTGAADVPDALRAAAA